MEQSKKSGKHFALSREARARFLEFALDPSNEWRGNLRDLNAMVTRLATLAEGGRISLQDVEEEIERCRASRGECAADGTAACEDPLAPLLGTGYAEKFDDFDLAQLRHVVAVCRASESAAAAAKKLFSVSRAAKKSANDSDRLTKYLARFGLKFKSL
jgi:transcriptional regulatory protein RtcR